MARLLFIAATMLLMVSPYSSALAQDVSVSALSFEAAENLDLVAVGELFKDSTNLEAFERSLNDPDTGINNLDLNDDYAVEYLRVLEEINGDTHFILLQAQLGENDFQDVASIEVERSGNADYTVEITGNELIYGPDYYVVPPPVRINTWPIVGWIYKPGYRPYRSAFYFGNYPRWWRPFRPVGIAAYRTRTVRFTTRNTFRISRTRTITASRVRYIPKNSNVVRQKATVTRSRKTVTKGGSTTTRTRTTRTRTTRRNR